MKLMITVSVLIFGSIGGWLGSLIDHGGGFGLWSVLLSTIGSFFGIWVGYKAGKSYL